MKEGKPLQPGDLPEEPNDYSSMFNSRRLQMAKAALEPRLRCTEVDENGKVILMDGEFKKSELIAKVCVFLRTRISLFNSSTRERGALCCCSFANLRGFLF